MAEDEDLDVAVGVIWALVAIVIIVIIIIIYLWWNKLWIFADTITTESSHRTDQYNTSMAVGQQQQNPYAGNPNVCHMKTIRGVPAPGSSFAEPPITVDLLTTFITDSDRNLAIQQPERFRLFFYCSHHEGPNSRPNFPHTSGQAGFARYMAPLELTEYGRYTIYCYAVLWKGPTPIAPPPPPPNPTAAILAQYAVKFEYFIGVDPNLFGNASGVFPSQSRNNIHIDIDDDDELGAFGNKNSNQSPENILEMQRLVAKHLMPPPGTYVAPLDVHVSTSLASKYVVTISPQHMIPMDDTQMFTLSVTGNHIVKLVSRNPYVSRSLEMAAVYVLLPPAPDIVPSRGSITELMPVSISSPAIINDVSLKHFYSVDGSRDEQQQPSQFYNAPFTIPCGEGSSERHARIVARTVGRDGTQSELAIADLQVLSGNVAVYDPSIPSPVCIVAALEPRLLLQYNNSDDLGVHGTHQPITPSDVVFFYRVVKDEKKRHLYSTEIEDDETLGEEGRFKIYNPTVAIAINDSHCRIEAYSERIGPGNARERSPLAHYSWSESMLESAHGPNMNNNNNASKNNSISRRSNSRQHSRAASEQRHQHRGTTMSPSSSSLTTMGHLKPPIMSVVCSGATMSFDDPPHKKYTIRYSLDGTALDENWREFQHGTEVDVSEYLKAFGKIDVIARYYVDRSNPAEPVRFGRSFTREFTMPFFSGAS